MSQQSIQLELPEALYERMRQIADESNRPVETLLVDSLTLLFGEPTNDLTPEQLEGFGDNQLWAIVHQHLAWPQDARISELTTQGKRGKLSEAEQKELDELLASLDHYILLRSQALLLLKKHGHDVEQRLKIGA